MARLQLVEVALFRRFKLNPLLTFRRQYEDLAVTGRGMSKFSWMKEVVADLHAFAKMNDLVKTERALEKLIESCEDEWMEVECRSGDRIEAVDRQSF